MIQGMGREIKFRLWDASKKVMHDYNQSTFLLQTDGRVNSHELGILEGYSNTAQLLPLQYIGRCDIDGMDIYEGDIVEVQCDCDIGYGGSCPHSSERQQIIWDEEGLKYDFNNSSQYGLADIDRESMEVIGNIYENPELLEDKQ